MKKLILLSSVMLLCLPLAAYAAGNGSPATNGQFKFGIGFDNDYVFNRDMKPTSIVVPIEEDGEIIPGCEIKRMYRSMLNVSFGVLIF